MKKDNLFKDQTAIRHERGRLDWSPVIQLAAEHGYAFTAEELVTTFLSGDRELTETELDQAVGAGQGGNDTIDGATGNDILRVSNTLDGGSGNDLLAGNFDDDLEDIGLDRLRS